MINIEVNEDLPVDWQKINQEYVAHKHKSFLPKISFNEYKVHNTSRTVLIVKEYNSDIIVDGFVETIKVANEVKKYYENKLMTGDLKFGRIIYAFMPESTSINMHIDRLPTYDYTRIHLCIDNSSRCLFETEDGNFEMTGHKIYKFCPVLAHKVTALTDRVHLIIDLETKKINAEIREQFSHDVFLEITDFKYVNNLREHPLSTLVKKYEIIGNTIRLYFDTEFNLKYFNENSNC